jgi:hypothetical protein
VGAALALLPLSLAGCASGHPKVTSTGSPASTTSLGPTTTASLPPMPIGVPPSTIPTTVPVTVAPTAPPRTTTTAKASPAPVNVGDSDNGKTVTMAAGGTLIVTLNADNWTFNPPTNAAVLTQTGATAQHRTSCIPGGTCGTTTAQFTARAAGQSQVVATRTYCGEAIQCTPATDHWSITVTVT